MLDIDIMLDMLETFELIKALPDDKMVGDECLFDEIVALPSRRLLICRPPLTEEAAATWTVIKIKEGTFIIAFFFLQPKIW
jgi:hypothetical protein